MFTLNCSNAIRDVHCVIKYLVAYLVWPPRQCQLLFVKLGYLTVQHFLSIMILKNHSKPVTAGWRSVNAPASHRCDTGSITDVGLRDGHLVIKSVGGFPPGTPISSHTKTTGTQTSVSTSTINISYITCFVIFVK